jgi:hypothetical protein
MQLQLKQLMVLNNLKNNYKPYLQLVTPCGNVCSCNLVDLTTNE